MQKCTERLSESAWPCLSGESSLSCWKSLDLIATQNRHGVLLFTRAAVSIDPLGAEYLTASWLLEGHSAENVSPIVDTKRERETTFLW